MLTTIWHSSREFAEYVSANTVLGQINPSVIYRRMYESDANNPKNFHSLPDHIKKILYLDAPDIIVEVAGEPIFSIEISTEAGTGHNAFQRFARLAASVENGVPALYIYPKATIVHRTSPKSVGWDELNPLIFHALEQVMGIHNIPALLFYYPSDFDNFASTPALSPNAITKGLKRDLTHLGCPDASSLEMRGMFKIINDIYHLALSRGPIHARSHLLPLPSVRSWRGWMQREFISTARGRTTDSMSPLSAVLTVPTRYLLNHLSQYERSSYQIGNLLRSRDETLIYCVDAAYRGDPYPGSLAAIDYVKARNGRSFEERDYNLVLAWGSVSVDHHNGSIGLASSKAKIDDLIADVQSSETRNILKKNYRDLRPDEIPRYFMQVRYGSTFSKNKQVRIYAYFADAILFVNGALWRDG